MIGKVKARSARGGSRNQTRHCSSCDLLGGMISQKWLGAWGNHQYNRVLCLLVCLNQVRAFYKAKTAARKKPSRVFPPRSTHAPLFHPHPPTAHDNSILLCRKGGGGEERLISANILDLVERIPCASTLMKSSEMG